MMPTGKPRTSGLKPSTTPVCSRVTAQPQVRLLGEPRQASSLLAPGRWDAGEEEAWAGQSVVCNRLFVRSVVRCSVTSCCLERVIACEPAGKGGWTSDHLVTRPFTPPPPPHPLPLYPFSLALYICLPQYYAPQCSCVP